MAILSSTGFYGFICSCVKQGASYANTFVSGVGGYGWKIWQYAFGKFRLEIDGIHFRDEIKSVDHNPSSSAPARKGILIKTNYNGIEGYSYIEADEIFIRGRAVFREVVIEQLNSIAGGLVVSSAHGKVVAAENVIYGGSSSSFLVLDAESSGSSGFIRGDMVLCERASYDEGTVTFEKKRYWMLCEKAGNTSDDDCPLSESLRAAGKKYIILSREVCEARGGDPAEGDVIVQFGYIADHGDLTNEMDIRDRQRAVMISQLSNTRAAFAEYQGIGATAPYFEIRETNEVTKICGKGSNKFTGDFSIVSESGNTNVTDYVNSSVEKGTSEVKKAIDSDIAGLTEALQAEFNNAYETLATKASLQVASNQISASVEEVRKYAEGGIEKISSDLKLLPGSISAQVEGSYANAGLEIKVTGTGQEQTSSIEMQADKVAIKNGTKTAALFKDGQLNTDLLNTRNLTVYGSFAEVPNVFLPNNQSEINLDFEKGFNWSTYNNTSDGGVTLYLPSDPQYAGVRSTIINTGYYDGGVLIGNDVNISITGGMTEIRINKKLKYKSSYKVSIMSLKLHVNGIAQLYAVDSGGSLIWYLMNPEDFYIIQGDVNASPSMGGDYIATLRSGSTWVISESN